MRVVLGVLSLLVLCGCPGERSQSGGQSAPAEHAAALDPAPDAPPEPFDDWYPDDIAPPPGTQYPCPLADHPLPRDMPGIPAADHRYVNHVYAMLLRCTQAKVSVFGELGRSASALEDYQQVTHEALSKIEAEPVPDGLAPFQEAVVQSIRLQLTFFEKAHAQLSVEREALKDVTGPEYRTRWETAWNAMFQIPEGRQASQQLLAAYGHMNRRYGSTWPEETSKAIYHHLCALDLF